MSKISPENLQSVLSRMPTSVSILTLDSEAGPAAGIVTTLNSVSLEPPLVSFCIRHGSEIEKLTKDEGTRIGVNVLADDQADIAEAVLQQTSARLSPDVSYSLTDDHLPRIEGILAWVACRVQRIQPVGNHDLVIADIEELTLLRDAQPMLTSVADIRSSFWEASEAAAL